MTAPRLHTIPAVAAHLSVSRTAVYDFIAKGELRTVNLGNGRSKSRVRDDELERFINARSVGAHSP